MPSETEYDELVMTLVESALVLPAQEREEYLRSHCTSNTTLYEEVKTRVEWEERMGGFLREPLVARPSADPIFEPGELIAERFRVVRELGRGGMGVVYEAIDEKLTRRVAIKWARHGFQGQLSPEARTALEVSHPNVCKLHELHTARTPSGKMDFLTMEFVDGETLAERIKNAGPPPEKEARAIALQICAGLAQAHRQGVIHGDLKTANVILSKTPDGQLRAVLTDFGLASFRPAGDGVPITGLRGGTPDYMAPELFLGARSTVASDLYALGVLLHVLRTGTAPLRDAAKPLAERQTADLPAPWNRVVCRCLATQPKDRFAAVEEISALLTDRRSLVRWMLVAAMIVIASLALLLWNSRESAGPPVRLAVLPVTVEGDPLAASSGLGADIADRLSGLRRNFTIIPPADVLRYKADTPQKARSLLAATHVLRTRLRHSGEQIFATAFLSDAASGQTLRELQGSYSVKQESLLAKAVIATVTGAFGLRSGVPAESVSAPAYPHYVQAVALMRRDNHSADEAIPYFQKAIELDPQSALPYAGLADAQLQKFDRGEGRQWLDEAGVHVEKAKSINADSAPVLLTSGYYQEEHGRYEQAVAEYTRATQLSPASAETWVGLASVYEKTNRAAEAVAAYQKAIEVQPDYYRTYLSLGNFYLFRSQFPEAEQWYRRLTELTPGLASGHMNLGLSQMQQGRFPEAEKSLLKSLQLHRDPRILMNVGALYYAEERFQESVRYFEESIAAGPPNAIRYRDLGDGYRHTGRSAEARKAYLAGRTIAEGDLARNPRQGYTRTLLGLFSAQLGDVSRAEFELSQALSMEPDNGMVMRDAAIAYEAVGQRDHALAALSKAPTYLLDELKRQPDVKSLRQDPRFQAIIDKPAR